VLRACIRRYLRNGIGHNAALDGFGLHTHTQAQAGAALSTKSDGVSTGPVTVPWRMGAPIAPMSMQGAISDTANDKRQYSDSLDSGMSQDQAASTPVLATVAVQWGHTDRPPQATRCYS
jgi:hypothetical protein